jgi:HSP90 family molecular chaperone
VQVLFFTEAIDEWTGAQLSEYKEHKLVNVTKEGLELDEDDKKKVEQAENLLKVLTHDFKSGSPTHASWSIAFTISVA